MALTDLIVRQAKPTGKTYRLPDTEGLGLVVTDEGAKLWHFRYYWLGKQKRLSFGRYPELSLKEARARRDEARAVVAKGINPLRHREKERVIAVQAAQNTFSEVYKQWFAFRAPRLKEGRNTSRAILPRVFKNDVLPALGRRPIHEISRFDLLEVLDRIEKRGATSVAKKVRGWFNRQIRARLAQVESALTDGPWFAGERFSMVDAAFGPVFRYFDVFDELGSFCFFEGLPKTADWRAALAGRESVREAAHPDYPALLRTFLLGRRSALSRRVNQSSA